MNTHTSGAASLSEGQRLLTERRGPFSNWIRRHPKATSWALVFLHMAIQGSSIFVFVTTYDYENRSIVTFSALLCAMVSGSLIYATTIYYRYWHSLTVYLIALAVETALTIWGGWELNLSIVGMAAWVLLYSVASQVTYRTALWVYAVSTVVYGLQDLWVTFARGDAIPPMTTPDIEPTSEWAAWLSGLVFAALWNLTIMVLGRSARRSRIFEREIVKYFEQTQALAATEERNRIAREMHDVVAHSLTVMITLADGARFVAKKNPEQAGAVLKELSSIGRNALADMRRTLGVLREDDDAVPYAPAEGAAENAIDNLRELAESFASTGMRVSFEHEGQQIPSDNNLRLSLYRILQESLTNALRYGQDARSIAVKVRVDLPDIWLWVVNDGAPVQKLMPSVGTGKGLTGMRERAAFHGGSVQAGPVEGGGWFVKAHVKAKDN